MYQDIHVEELLSKKSGIPLVDLRSPGEYHEATIPGACNIYLLDNIERALVGTVYKNEGPEKAREMAMEILAPRLPVFYYAFKKIAHDKEVIIFCWRGGDRSHFAGCILDAMGYKVYRLVGGYKAYRRYVLQYLEREMLPLRAVVINGLTGVGKTDVLRELSVRGYPVLDLEGLAGHRGSVFGKIGQPPSPSQKMFESLIVTELQKAESYGIFIVECESRRLGNLYVPGSVMNTMQRGYRILLYAPVEERIKRILRDYAPGGSDNLEALHEAINRLGKYLGKSKTAELHEWLSQGNISGVIEFLLSQYYDPLYKYPDGPSLEYELSINTDNMEKAVQKIEKFIKELAEFHDPRR